jgi:hypothetical protein
VPHASAPPRHLRALPRRLSTPLRWLLSLALLTPLVAGVAGIGLPRVSRQQYGAGRQVSLKALRAGDLLFYAKDTSDRRTIYHVGMYLGSGRMVEAPNRRAPIRIASIWRPGLLGKATRPAAGPRGCRPSSSARAATPWPPSSSASPPTSAAWPWTASSVPAPAAP